VNLQTRLALRAADVAPDWLEYRTGITVVPHNHPPSLRNPKKVTQSLATDGWHPSDSQKKKQQARRDMKTIMERTVRQEGKPVMIRHAIQNTQSIYGPTPFY
jgi:hypothetical protein